MEILTPELMMILITTAGTIILAIIGTLKYMGRRMVRLLNKTSKEVGLLNDTVTLNEKSNKRQHELLFKKLEAIDILLIDIKNGADFNRNVTSIQAKHLDFIKSDLPMTAFIEAVCTDMKVLYESLIGLHDNELTTGLIRAKMQHITNRFKTGYSYFDTDYIKRIRPELQKKRKAIEDLLVLIATDNLINSKADRIASVLLEGIHFVTVLLITEKLKYDEKT